MGLRQKSATYYVLQALIPFSEANLHLTFKPHVFFNELDKIDRLNKHTARNAYYRAVKKGYIELDDQNRPTLTEQGRRTLAPYVAKQLKDADLLVIFDIQEGERWRRDRLRAVLREFSFEQVQKSVWITKLDCISYLHSEIKNLKLDKEVKLFEAKLIK